MFESSVLHCRGLHVHALVTDVSKVFFPFTLITGLRGIWHMVCTGGRWDRGVSVMGLICHELNHFDRGLIMGLWVKGLFQKCK